MARVVINALNLRPGGGLQVIAGLLSRFSPENHYTVLWSDPQSLEFLERTVGSKPFISFVRPSSATGNLAVFMWQMTRLGRWLARNSANVVVNVNHHFPTGRVPQIVYHLNVLRFARPRGNILAMSEIADRLRDWRARLALMSAEANVFESHYLLSLAQSILQAIRNPSVQYIGLDDRSGDVAVIRENPPPHILVMTSPQPHKDNGLLLDILKELTIRQPDIPWRLRIAGGRTPAAFADLRTQAVDMKIDGHIDWLGFRSHAELADIGNACLCLVSTSRVESFCMVALEAMSWACPAIVANATSMPESVGDAGLLAEPGNAGDFAGKIVNLWTSPALRHELAARGLAQARRNSWTAAAQHFEDLIRALAPHVAVVDAP